MKYYIRDKEIDMKKAKFIGEGLETKVYKSDKYVLKIYKSLACNNELIYKLSRINLNRIAKPIDFIYDRDSKIRGYSSLFIDRNYNKISSLNTIRLFDNIKMINNDFNILNKHGIASCDCHIGNLIYDKYGNIYIIDVGNFYESMFDRQRQVNNNSLVYITEELLLTDIKDFTNYSLIKSYIKEKLFDRDLFDYLKKDVCKWHTIHDYQSQLIRKLNR